MCTEVKGIKDNEEAYEIRICSIWQKSVLETEEEQDERKKKNTAAGKLTIITTLCASLLCVPDSAHRFCIVYITLMNRTHPKCLLRYALQTISYSLFGLGKPRWFQGCCYGYDTLPVSAPIKGEPKTFSFWEHVYFCIHSKWLNCCPGREADAVGRNQGSISILPLTHESASQLKYGGWTEFRFLFLKH